MSNVERILDAVYEATRIPPLDMLGRSRLMFINDARQVAMLLMSENLGMSNREIGEVFCGRHRTTVLSAIRSIRNKAETDAGFRRLIAIATINFRSPRE